MLGLSIIQLIITLKSFVINVVYKIKGILTLYVKILFFLRLCGLVLTLIFSYMSQSGVASEPLYFTFMKATPLGVNKERPDLHCIRQNEFEYKIFQKGF